MMHFAPIHADQSNRNLGLDLIRCIAIGLVLLSHFGGAFTFYASASFPLYIMLPGYYGVELFFVLSGFLIGNLLIDISAKGFTGRAWRLFIIRRMMRTVPAYFACIVLFLLIDPPPNASIEVWQFPLFLQNLAWPMPYWFSVSWSLTIEEWFYLLFSAAAFAGLALFPRHGLWIALAVFLLIPPVLRAMVPPALEWDLNIRKIVIERLDVIAYGVLLATLLRRGTVLMRYKSLLFFTGLLILSASLAEWSLRFGDWQIKDPIWRVFIFNITSIGFLLLFPALLQIELTSYRAIKLIRTLSALSYSLYLVHLSTLNIALPWIQQRDWQGLVATLLAMLATIGLATLVFILVERPVMRRRPPQFAR